MPSSKILHHVHVRVFPADDVPGWPPGAGVRVDALGDVDRAESLQAGFILPEVDLQLVQALQIERRRCPASR